MGNHQAFTLPICRGGKTLEVGTWCLLSETFLYLSEVIHLIGRCLIGEVSRYIENKKGPIQFHLQKCTIIIVVARLIG